MQQFLLLLILPFDLVRVIWSQNCSTAGCKTLSDPCCSQFGYCGNTAEHCEPSNGCQSGCWTANSGTSKLYHHCITFRYRPKVTQTQIDSVTKAYLNVEQKALQNGKKYVKISGGRTITTEGIASNFRNGFILTFTSAEGSTTWFRSVCNEPILLCSNRSHFMCCEKAHQDFGDFMGQYVVSKDYNVGFDFEEEVAP